MSRPKIVLKHTYGGLGDNLTHSTLPEIFTKKGYDVYISTKQEYRNVDVKYLIDMNPFIKGYSDLPPNMNVDEFLKTTYPIHHPNKNYNARIELAIFGQAYNNYPKIYYTPIYLPWWSDKTVIDLSSVSHQHPVDFMKHCAFYHNTNCIDLSTDYKTRNIFEYINIIYSCKKFICVYSGGNALAAALNKRNTECYATKQWIDIIKSAYFYHYCNVNYICVEDYNYSLINVRD